MQERIFRFGITGLTFILSTWFWFWYFGGSIGEIININDEKIIASIIGLASTPALGFIVSSISKEIWEYVYPKQPLLFLNPEPEYAQDYLKYINDRFPINSGVNITKDGIYDMVDRKKVFLNQQILLRNSGIEKEALSWVSRRMDVVYAQINGFYSIILGFVIGVLLRILLYANSSINFHFSLGKFFWIILIIIYCVVAFIQAKRALKEANNFEKILLLNHKKECKSEDK